MIVVFEAHTDIDDTDARVDIEFGTPDSVYASPEDLLAINVYKATADIVDVISKEIGINHHEVYDALAILFKEARDVRD